MRLIALSFDGVCTGCGTALSAGTQAWWERGRPLRCADCGPDFAGEDRRGAATAAEDVPGYVRELQKDIKEAAEAARDGLKGLNERLDRLEAWAIRLSAELNTPGPRDH